MLFRLHPISLVFSLYVIVFLVKLISRDCVCNVEVRHPFWQEQILNATEPVVDVVTAVDGPDYYQGMLALLNSTIYNHIHLYGYPLRFHIIVPDTVAKSGKLHLLIRNLFQEQYSLPPGSINIIGFNSDVAKSFIHVWTGTFRHINPLNFARFWLPQLLPSYVKRVIYLDPDMIVQRPLHSALQSLDGNDFCIAAVSANGNYARFLTTRPDLVKYSIERKNLIFNAGMLVIDLERWSRRNISEKLEWWLNLHKENNIWKFGSQGPLLVVFYRGWHALEKEWNVDGLGYLNPIRSMDMVKSAFILHWNGSRKPWNSPIWDGREINFETKALPHAEYHPFWSKYFDRRLVLKTAAKAGFEMIMQKKPRDLLTKLFVNHL